MSLYKNEQFGIKEDAEKRIAAISKITNDWAIYPRGKFWIVRYNRKVVKKYLTVNKR